MVMEPFQSAPGVVSKMFASYVDHPDNIVVPTLRSQSPIYPNVVQDTQRIGGEGDVTSFSEVLVS
jgi:hypothetical protein